MNIYLLFRRWTRHGNSLYIIQPVKDMNCEPQNQSNHCYRKGVFNGIESSSFVVAYIKITEIKNIIWTKPPWLWLKKFLGSKSSLFLHRFNLTLWNASKKNTSNLPNCQICPYAKYVCCFNKQQLSSNFVKQNHRAAMDASARLPRSPFRITRALELVFLVGQGDARAQQVGTDVLGPMCCCCCCCWCWTLNVDWFRVVVEIVVCGCCCWWWWWWWLRSWFLIEEDNIYVYVSKLSIFLWKHEKPYRPAPLRPMYKKKRTVNWREKLRSKSWAAKRCVLLTEGWQGLKLDTNVW